MLIEATFEVWLAALPTGREQSRGKGSGSSGQKMTPVTLGPPPSQAGRTHSPWPSPPPATFPLLPGWAGGGDFPCLQTWAAISLPSLPPPCLNFPPPRLQPRTPSVASAPREPHPGHLSASPTGQSRTRPAQLGLTPAVGWDQPATGARTWAKGCSLCVCVLVVPSLREGSGAETSR